MRRAQVWKVLSVVFFGLCVTVLITRGPANVECPDLSDPYLQTREVKNHRLFDVNRDALQSLEIPYKYLLGSPPSGPKRFLSIGISSVKRNKESYLLTTIQSIFGHCSQNELDELVVVIYLANARHTDNRDTAEKIKHHFPEEIAAGHLIVISSYINGYPLLDGLRRNYNDSPDRVRFRSKQNVDYAFLVNFCANLSHYYLMLEDDVTCSVNFLTSIRKYINEYTAPWTTITFSNLGYIGKLYHSEDLPKLSRFLLLFYDEMPCDWLLDLFYRSKAQADIIRYKPSLFQHIGQYSSFQGNANRLKDKDFVEVLIPYGDQPVASCFTDIKAYNDNTPDNVCIPGPSFFWGMEIDSGNNFTMVFQTPTNIKKISIITGTPEHPRDILQSGIVQVGREKDLKKETCKIFRKIGEFGNGTFLLDNIDHATGGLVDCLKIQVSAPQANWLIIQKIGIWVRKEKIHNDTLSHVVLASR
ncbi:alpha-1,3-mannosyl-glycoprotein 4-beta-N-acetylglucosaminyltransferase C-like [Hyla sarda]|uniref:alpha-1,3-mannosyl-glycoprotein 4-beta-N-acetylglucosaminyltransferase C-like n=1 Tax=Hyla sarda TaxID=327740 RepID=UPI0024C3F31F|nr:alpha-1,3-mannosyl-glycoprotein 4-beta-N-acetylglucosaminyltransferase C-like [Hyla sarda]XP_056383943.1 alpha-1,3-mannosyl-glycoprotein 4-beta-N-acetylglucosaminyltransferase C-like [Hyla sarda]